MTLSFIRNSQSPNKNILFTWDGENLYLGKLGNDSKSLALKIATYKENCLCDISSVCYRSDGEYLRVVSQEEEYIIGNLEGVNIIIDDRYYNYITDNGSFIIYREQRIYESDDTNIPIEVYSFILYKTINTCVKQDIEDNDIDYILSRLYNLSWRLGLYKSNSSGSYVIDYIKHIFKINENNPWHTFNLGFFFSLTSQDDSLCMVGLGRIASIFNLHNASYLYKRILAEYIYILLTDRILFKELSELGDTNYSIRLGNNNVLFRHYIENTGVSYFVGSEYNPTYLKNSFSLEASRFDLINSIIKNKKIKLSAQVKVFDNSLSFAIENISLTDESDYLSTWVNTRVIFFILILTLLNPPSFIFKEDSTLFLTCMLLFIISFYLVLYNKSDFKNIQNPFYYLFLFIMSTTLLILFGLLLYKLITTL
jgi:hypothetical protein